MILTLITPATTPVVALDDLKLHLRVDHNDDDTVITALEAAAVGYLDGWRGVLGRAILSQTWRQEFAGWGELRLALPDVASVVVTYVDALGDEVPAAGAELRKVADGYCVIVDGPSTDRVFVNMSCAMSAGHLATAEVLVKMIVAHWYQHREAVMAGAVAEVPMSASALIGMLRWARL